MKEASAVWTFLRGLGPLACTLAKFRVLPGAAPPTEHVKRQKIAQKF